jgi:hypothetical protein
MAAAIIVLVLGAFGGTPDASDQGSELISLLTKNLGVTEGQAQGGSGAIFNLAKEQLSAEDFSAIASVVPGMDTLLNAAPQVSELSKTIGGKTSLMGGSTDKVGNPASLTDSFSKLGMKSDMVSKCADLILSHVNATGGASVANILAGVLK